MSERRLAEALLARVDADWGERKRAFLASFGGPLTPQQDEIARRTYAYARLDLTHEVDRLKVHMMASVPVVGRLWLLGKLRGSS